MDLVLEIFDTYLLDSIYDATTGWARDNMLRQCVSLYWIVLLFSGGLYFGLSSIDYFYFFDHRILRHKFILENQVSKEIKSAVSAMLIMDAMTLPVWLAEIRGYSKLYMGVEEHGGWAFMAATLVWFLIFTDTCIYWIHRSFHHPLLYPWIHKEHHRWKMPTPFACVAFTPIDGWSQGLPYHIFVFLFPMHKVLYLLLFFGVQVWTVSIHDQIYFTRGTRFESIINGADHHTEHHLKFNCNYGQFFTFWDRLCGSHLNSEDSSCIVEKMPLKPLSNGKVKAS